MSLNIFARRMSLQCISRGGKQSPPHHLPSGALPVVTSPRRLALKAVPAHSSRPLSTTSRAQARSKLAKISKTRPEESVLGAGAVTSTARRHSASAHAQVRVADNPDQHAYEQEAGYHELRSSMQVSKKEWITTPADYDGLIIGAGDRLDIDGHPVMQRWETPYMAELAKVATSQGGKVLEVGFGMGISASAVQQHAPDEHIIIEANADVFERLQGFAAKSANRVTPLHGLWQDALAKVASDSVDGILYDTYPLNKEEQHVHQFDFIKEAFRVLKPGGILTYCNLTSLGVLKCQYETWEELFVQTQLPHLLECGFKESDIGFEVVPAAPTSDCEYYSHDTALLPIMTKPAAPPQPCAPLPTTGVVRAKRTVHQLQQQLMAAEQSLVIAEKRDATQQQQQALNQPAQPRHVNAWTQWGNLREIVVGVADDGCFIPEQPAMQPSINKEGGSGATDHKNSNAGAVIDAEMPWPQGRKKQATIDAANAQLDNLARTLEKRGIRVLRPDATMDWTTPLQTPFFQTPNQYCSTCGRDSLITLGNIILEAGMSRRDRYFEVFAYRDIIRGMLQADPNMMWKAAPKPSMRDEMYNQDWWEKDTDERYAHMHEFEFCITNEEPTFDAADIMRCGKDIFMQLSMTCNQSGIAWLKKELAPHGFRVHTVRFPYDLAPSHLDCTFVPLRPGLVLVNPERPIMEEDAKIFKDNGWRFLEAPLPKNPVRPWASQSSKWLSMNVLSLGPSTVVVEEEETPMHALLEDEGFEVVTVPFRDVYEFGGGLHCSTWDLTRDDHQADLFPVQP